MRRIFLNPQVDIDAKHPGVSECLGEEAWIVHSTSPTSLMERHRAAVVSEIKMLLLAKAVCTASFVGSCKNSAIFSWLSVSCTICNFLFCFGTMRLCFFHAFLYKNEALACVCMNVLFRSRCEALVRDCVNASLRSERREADRAELLGAARLDRRARRRELCRRLKTLEAEMEALRSEQERVRQRMAADDALLAELSDDLRRRLDEEIEERRVADMWARLSGTATDVDWTSL